MQKGFFGKLIFLLTILACIVFFIVSLCLPEVKFEWSWCIAAVCGVAFLCMLGKALRQNDVLSKRANMFIAIIFLVACACALIFAFIPDFPQAGKIGIVAGVVVIGFIIQLFVTGGKKWDAGDNEKVGYKNYYQRKAEEEKKNK